MLKFITNKSAQLAKLMAFSTFFVRLSEYGGYFEVTPCVRNITGYLFCLNLALRREFQKIQKKSSKTRPKTGYFTLSTYIAQTSGLKEEKIIKRRPAFANTTWRILSTYSFMSIG